MMGSTLIFSCSLMAGLLTAMLLLISRWRFPPFIVLLTSAWLLAFLSGIEVKTITPMIAAGMGKMFGHVALVIITGTLLGKILEQSGGTVPLADRLIALAGNRYPVLPLAIMGYFVSIPVYCDSGFILLSSLRQSLADRGKGHPIALNTGLAGGLYATSALVPPTPGPAAAAVILGLSPGVIIIPGMLLALVATLVAVGWGSLVAGGLPDANSVKPTSSKQKESTTNIFDSNCWALLPITLPLLLMTTTASQHNQGQWFETIGQPVNALLIGVVAAIPMIRHCSKSFSELLAESISSSAVIILIITAGGALAEVLSETGHVQLLASYLPVYMGLLLPFTIAMIFKVAQGATTVALISAVSLVEVMLPALGLDSETGRILALFSAAAGSLVVAHANDSYFWVVTQFGGMDVATGYRSFTMATLWQGLTCLLIVLLAGHFL
ncbi:gluconate transporter [Endozoicomonas sp. OPT23]|uniref:GntP family permease n=1 Tax=Endozoicomonas sp. OPT23 TaxID=2072845 RepID=UPI00129A9A63|nr:GntP family permease [Endozoicomonas sp. OPT23]MRI34812.1 gluconate transporter [Endozoicomonas sp. OPT23]